MKNITPFLIASFCFACGGTENIDPNIFLGNWKYTDGYQEVECTDRSRDVSSIANEEITFIQSGNLILSGTIIDKTFIDGYYYEVKGNNLVSFGEQLGVIIDDSIFITQKVGVFTYHEKDDSLSFRGKGSETFSFTHHTCEYNVEGNLIRL
jgi:hypothetical protein